MSEDEAAAGSWERRGIWAWLHALRVLDPSPDVALQSVVSMAARASGSPVMLWLRDGPGWTPSASSDEVIDTDAPDPGGDESVIPVVLDGFVVGQLRGGSDAGVVLEAAAAEVARRLADRWTALRRDADDRPVGVVVVDSDLFVRWLSPELDELARGESQRWMGGFVLEHAVLEEPAEAEGLANLLTGRGRTAPIPVRLTVSKVDGPQTFDVQAENRFDDPDVGALSFVLRPNAGVADEYRMLGDQMWVMQRLSAGRPLDEVLVRVVELVEHQRFDAHCCVMLVDRAARTLEPAIAPGFDDEVIDALRGIEVGPDQPAGGASAHFNMPQYSNDIWHDPAWIGRRELLHAHGYRACWSMPILSMTANRVLGTVDIYPRSAGMPVDTDIRVLSMAARLAALAIDHATHEHEMRYAATHDPLTRLPNRTLFAERLMAAALDGDLAVLFLDLDRFKLVNDTLGHEFGDDLLRAVAGRLAHAVRSPSIVARFGGDEFTVLLPSVADPDAAVVEAERLLAVIAEPYRIRNQTVVVRASAGAAVGTGPHPEPLSLVRDADAALYHAKDRGRARVELFDDRILQVASRRLQVERMLSDALDAGLVEVEFQPSVRLIDGKVVGVEALARCRTPDGGTIAPETFIPVAEETGMISRVFDAVLAESCRVAKLWNEGRADPLVVWVNLSPQQLGTPDLVAQVCRAFDLSGVDPTLLGVEVTEQGILWDPDEAAERLSALVALGTHAALDDFGTGYSSLSHLKDLPVDTVKLDRSFVVRADENQRSSAIVGGVVRLAEAMGLRCIAEGVETDHELDVVASLGCEIVQGFVYCRPRAASELTDWMATPVPPFAPAVR